jgi:repressor LexA
MATRNRTNRRKDDVLSFVTSYFDGNGYPPTYEEIREAVGLSSRSHVAYYVQALEEGGLVERSARSPRSLRPVRLDSASEPVEQAPGRMVTR